MNFFKPFQALWPKTFPVAFEWPHLLWLLLAVPLLVLFYLWLLRRKKKLALRYASLALVREAMGSARQIRGIPRGRGGHLR